MKRFLLEKNKYANGVEEISGWWEIKGDKLENGVGGWHDYHPSDDDIIAEADSWDELDYSYLIDNESEYGWISPDGKWYGCAYRDHSAVASRVIGESEQDLEENGWIKVYRSLFNRAETGYSGNDRMTEQQARVLFERGLIDDKKMERLGIFL